MLANVRALRDHGAEEVWVFATHGLFCDGAIAKFETPDIAGIVVTDTVPIDPLTKPDNMTVLPGAPLLAETIMNVFADDSVSRDLRRREPTLLAARRYNPAPWQESASSSWSRTGRSSAPPSLAACAGRG